VRIRTVHSDKGKQEQGTEIFVMRSIAKYYDADSWHMQHAYTEVSMYSVFHIITSFVSN